MSVINLQNIRQAEGLMDDLYEVRTKIEQRINLDKYSNSQKNVAINGHKIMGICLLAGLSSKEKRDLAAIENIQMSKTSNRIFETLFTLHNLDAVYSALLKLRYNGFEVDWENAGLKSKIINAEILRGSKILLNDSVLDEWLLNTVNYVGGSKAGRIPYLNLNIGTYEDNIIDLIADSYIIKMDVFPKDGPIAKAIVYFIVSKLNTIYEKLPKQAVDDEFVEIRHFTIIDEAHFMLGFDNKPLRDLIAVGRNKGLSIILATQNIDSYKSEYFDFYANARHPLIMKQQSINDGVIKDLFGISGNEFNEIKQAISGLQKGELIIRNPTAIALGMGKRFKKI